MIERIHYIDLAKGILILLVILGHIGWACSETIGVNLLLQSHVMNHIWALFAPCYMSAFFIITGFCSNIEKPFGEFVKKSFLTLTFPAILIGGIISIVETWSISRIPHIIINWGDNWFLSAMFFGRIIYWLTHKAISNSYIRIISLSMLSFVGLWLSYTGYANLYSIQQTFIFTVFLGIGVWVKEKKIFDNRKVLFILGSIYLIIKIWSVVSHTLLPTVCQVIEASPYQTVLFIIEGICGTSLIVLFAKLLDKNEILEYFGRNSLLIYLTHQAFISAFIGLFGGYIITYSNLWVIGTLIWCALFLFSVVPCILIINMINSKYLKWIIGK